MLLVTTTTCVVILGLSLASGTTPPLRLHDVPHDGDCLFSAAALSAALVDGDPTQARARAVRTAAARLRALANDLLCPTGSPDPELTLGGLPAALLIEPRRGESDVGYCKRMRQAGEWGSSAEVLALAHVLRRPIRIHTAFGGAETYGADEGGPEAQPLVLHYANHHYQAATEPAPAPAAPVESTDAEACDASGATLRLRGGAGGGSDGGDEDGDEDGDEAAVGAVLDALHAAAARADADAYFPLFAPSAVFLGTDPGERWPLDEFKAYAGARFARGDGWRYEVLERHVSVRDGVAWFDETLRNAKLGACRSSGVLLRQGTAQAGDGEGSGMGWRVTQYNLQMAIPNDAALEVAEISMRHDK